jgi:hypothetical protein
MNINIKEKIIQNKGKIIAAAVVVGIIGVGIATKGKSVNQLAVERSKDLPIPEGVVGVWSSLWKQTQTNGTYLNAIVDDVKVEDLGEFGKALVKAGYSDTSVGLLVAQSVKK